MKELINAVLEWWDQHWDDAQCSQGEEYNVYDEPPEFVKLAQKLKDEQVSESTNSDSNNCCICGSATSHGSHRIHD